jgi:hypothetical protein
MRGAVGPVVVSLVVSLTVAAGCTLGSGQPDVGCENVPSAACDEQVLQVAAGLSGVESVDVVCGDEAPCTRAGGSGLAEIRFSNGQKVSRPWSYVGDAGPPPVVTCVGIAAGPCHLAMSSESDFVSPSKHIATGTVTCTSARCTDQEGSVTVHIVLGDGSVEDRSSSWTSQ